MDLDGNFSWRTVAKVAVGFAAVAGAVACGASIVCGVAVGAIAGAASYAADKAGTEEFNDREMAKEAILGAGLGALSPSLARVGKDTKTLTWGYSRYRHGGGGFNIHLKNRRIFAIDKHPFKHKGKRVNRIHVHYGRTKSQMKKHRMIGLRNR